MAVIAKLLIKAALREGKTYLERSFYTTPFKLANVTEDKNDHRLKLMLMSSSPGILNGDEYKIKIELEEGCSVQLQTQSYQRLFDMKKGASQNMEVFLGPNSSFYYLPHPTVPHKSSDFVATNKIYLCGGCRLVWGEVLTCGRKLSGEVFAFTRYQNRTETFLNRRLVVKENLLIRPGETNVHAIGQLEGYSHQASLIFIDEKADVVNLVREINKELSRQEKISFGVSALPVNGIILRLLGYKGEQLFNCLQTISNLIIAEEPVLKL